MSLFLLQKRIGTYPWIAFPLFYAFGTRKHRAVSLSSDLVIEGFSRSANSFAVSAFRMAQDRAVSIATHLHQPCNVIRGIRLRKPVMLLIRDPISAVISLKSLYIEKRQRRVSSSTLFTPSFKDLFTWYTLFYESLLPYRNDVLVLRFEQVTRDFGKCIEDLNRFYSTHFQVFNHTPENVSTIFSKRFHIGPNDLREAIKQQVNLDYEQSLPYIKYSVDQARDTYYKFVNLDPSSL